MTFTSKNIARHELIGSVVKVIESSDPNKKGLQGKIVDETRNTIKLLTKDGEKTVPKKECKFLFLLKGDEIEVLGKDLVGRPEDRTKR